MIAEKLKGLPLAAVFLALVSFSTCGGRGDSTTASASNRSFFHGGWDAGAQLATLEGVSSALQGVGESCDVLDVLEELEGLQAPLALEGMSLAL